MEIILLLLRGEDNAADAPSRGSAVDPTIRATCLDVFNKFREGKIRVEPLADKPAPCFSGFLRHPDDEL